MINHLFHFILLETFGSWILDVLGVFWVSPKIEYIFSILGEELDWRREGTKLGLWCLWFDVDHLVREQSNRTF